MKIRKNKLTLVAMETIVILGGGPCGLSAAWELSTTGKNVVVIEAQSTLGGLCKTVSYKGFNFDLGGHRFIFKMMCY